MQCSLDHDPLSLEHLNSPIVLIFTYLALRRIGLHILARMKVSDTFAQWSFSLLVTLSASLTENATSKQWIVLAQI